MPEFFMNFELEHPNWLDYLQQHGVVVVKNVLTKQEVQNSNDKYWEYLDSNYQFMKRKYPTKWRNGGGLVVKDQRTLHDKNWPVAQNGFS